MAAEASDIPLGVFIRMTPDEQLSFVNEVVQRVNENLPKRWHKKPLSYI